MQSPVRSRIPAIVAVIGLVSAGAAAAPPPQSPNPPDETDRPIPVFGVESSLVLLDVVVRDKHGHLVRNLTADDFEVYEDGKRQALDAFDVIDNEVKTARKRPPREGRTPTPPVADAGPTTTVPAPPREAPGQGDPAVVAFVFDRLSPEGRDRANKAARIYAEKEHVPGDIVGVFVLDQALHTLLPFSTDLAEIRAAFDRAAMQAHTAFAADRERARQASGDAMEIERQLTALGRIAGAGGAGTQARAQAAALGAQLVAANMEARMRRMEDRVERDQQGFASTHGLLAIVSGLRALPGRKTIVFFSEGLTISGNVEEQFESVAAIANRANVSVYAMDAGGLRAVSETQEARKELSLLVNQRVSGFSRPPQNGSPMMEGLERSQDMLTLNPHARLGELAEDTGGFLIRDTNDARDGLRRLLEEMRFYYLLSYSPTNSEFDGTYRSITVKVKRKGAKVHSRKGYLALPPAPPRAEGY